ncbi:MAG: superoxide dismutase family protein [Litorimonas sp.]
MQKPFFIVSALLLTACGSGQPEVVDAPDTPSAPIVQSERTTVPAAPTQATLMERRFDVMNSAGREIGTATIRDVEGAGIVMQLAATSLPEGSRAIHFHEIGSCDAPSFTSAGGHYNPGGHNHGFDAEAPNPHAGDMPNFTVPASGMVDVEIENDRVTLSERDGLAPLLDANGTALIIHAEADDYRTQPTGAAGARIACAVIAP